MKEYTEKIHRKRLVKMLLKKEPCGCCPANKHYSATGLPFNQRWFNDPCIICQDFVQNLRKRQSANLVDTCPCYAYGEEKAIELTIKALKKKGDL